MSYNLSQIMKSAHRNYKKGGKTFSECLKSAWSFAKLQESFSPEAVKSRTDKFLAERHEAMSKTAKATPSKEYKTDNYRAIVSGYKPSLDFMEVYRDKEIITLSPLQKKKRWGLGLQTGYSYPGGWYVGVGISCNLIMW